MAKECELCCIKLDEHDFANHVVGKKHMKKVEAENLKKGLIEKSIYVSNLPPDLGLQDLITYFTQFGAIEKCKHESNFAIIEFKNCEPVNFLLSRPIWMGSYKLEIKKRRFIENRPTAKNKLPDTEKSPTEIIFADLKTKLQSQTTFDGELATFYETVRLNENEVEYNWRSLQSSLIETLRPSFPRCEISRFGSSVTELAFKGSDMDVYLNDGEKVTRGWTPKTIFNEVKYLMYRKRNFFDSIVPIPKAKTPIIKFCHVPTGTNCDISFKNGLGVINSHLIKQLINYDSRIKPLMIIIKYWAKTFELSGCGKFTNYAIVMLIIFYLQQSNCKLLPPIAELRKNGKPQFCWNWQVNFDADAVLPKSTNTSTVTELVHGFFKFYVDFTFADKLICPIDGRAHVRTDFAKYCTDRGADPDYLGLDKPVCLQDPIELDNNITAGVRPTLLENFQRFCAVGIDVTEVAIREPNKIFLLSLFTTVPITVKQKDIHEIVISSQKTLRAGLPQDFDERDDIEDRDKFVENNWYTLVQRLAEETLQRVFKLRIQRLNADRVPKQQKVDATSDVHSNDDDKIVFQCTGEHNVIFARKSKGFCIDPSLGQIDKEALVSDEVINKQKENGTKITTIDFTCTIVRAKSPVRLILRLTDRNTAKKQYRPLIMFLDAKLPSIINKELIHMLQYNKR